MLKVVALSSYKISLQNDMAISSCLTVFEWLKNLYLSRYTDRHDIHLKERFIANKNQRFFLLIYEPHHLHAATHSSDNTLACTILQSLQRP